MPNAFFAGPEEISAMFACNCGMDKREGEVGSVNRERRRSGGREKGGSERDRKRRFYNRTAWLISSATVSARFVRLPSAPPGALSASAASPGSAATCSKHLRGAISTLSPSMPKPARALCEQSRPSTAVMKVSLNAGQGSDCRRKRHCAKSKSRKAISICSSRGYWRRRVSQDVPPPEESWGGRSGAEGKEVERSGAVGRGHSQRTQNRGGGGGGAGEDQRDDGGRGDWAHDD